MAILSFQVAYDVHVAGNDVTAYELRYKKQRAAAEESVHTIQLNENLIESAKNEIAGVQKVGWSGLRRETLGDLRDRDGFSAVHRMLER